MCFKINFENNHQRLLNHIYIVFECKMFQKLPFTYKFVSFTPFFCYHENFKIGLPRILLNVF